MPNWCYNSMVFNIKDNEDTEVLDDLYFHMCNPLFDSDDKIWDTLKDKYSDTHDTENYKWYTETMSDREHAKLITYPLEPDENIMSFENIVTQKDNPDPKDWYMWRCNNWGTKWDVSESVSRDTNSLSMMAETAWSPCEPIVKVISEQYPEIEATHYYDECGVGFCGFNKYDSGDIVDSDNENNYKTYREAVANIFEDEDRYPYRCKSCGEYIEEYEIEAGEECYQCGSREFIYDDGDTYITLEELDEYRKYYKIIKCKPEEGK